MSSKQKQNSNTYGWTAINRPKAYAAKLKQGGASIWIPIAGLRMAGTNGWLEDGRPNSAADSYKEAARVIKTIKTVPEYAMVNGR